MLTGLWNFLGPVLLIGAFYVLLGLVVRLILHPPATRRRLRPTLARLAERMPDLPLDRTVQRQALWLVGVGVIGLLVPGPTWVRLLAAQAVAAAFLLALLDLNLRRREQAQVRRELLAALRHPQPDAVAEALRQAAAAGLLADGLLAGQDWQRVQWADAQLAGADLHGSNLTDADLQNANLRGANLAGCVLDGAQLGKADLTGASLAEASLVSVQAKAALFAQADLSHVVLRQAKLTNTDFTAACLECAQFAGAGLKGARLDYARLTGARYDETTRWPKRFDPVLAGAMPEDIAVTPQNDGTFL